MKTVTDDPEGDVVTVRYQWRVNGRIVHGESRSTFDPHLLHKGDRVSVAVVPYDGHAEGSAASAETIIGNTPPEVAELVVKPSEPRVGDRLSLEATAVDLDGDPVRYRYRWFKNNSELPDREEEVLPVDGAMRGDVFVVEVTPYDEWGRGRSRFSEPLLIQNSPPRIMSAPPSKVELARFIYEVKAEDADGDPVSYALEASPPGMKIDEATGRIEWPLGGRSAGVYRVRVAAKDPIGGRGFQEFDLSLTAPLVSSRMGSFRTLQLRARLVSRVPALLE
ncbi:Ig domain-containing protein [Candidatus Nitrospira bockiana]